MINTISIVLFILGLILLSVTLKKDNRNKLSYEELMLGLMLTTVLLLLSISIRLIS